MAKRTRATKLLEQAGIAFTAVVYDYDSLARSRGLQAAEALGEPPDRVLKTLLALVDGRPVCVIAPSDRDVSMKRLAVAFGGKSAQMMPPVDAERITGYKIGGISPFGQLRQLPTVIDIHTIPPAGLCERWVARIATATRSGLHRSPVERWDSNAELWPRRHPRLKTRWVASANETGNLGGYGHWMRGTPDFKNDHSSSGLQPTPPRSGSRLRRASEQD